MSLNSTRKNQEEIFRQLYQQHQGTPMAVSSESWAHKNLRYKMIAELFAHEQHIQLHDVGMGLAAFYDFLKSEFPEKSIDYSGTEILSEYVEAAQVQHPELVFYNRDLAENPGDERYDYLMLSGVFHQRRASGISEWEKFSQHLLRNAFAMCNKGIAFNFISPFVDFYQTEVYYCNLPKLLNFINDDLSRFFELKHNYALFEFTVFVYKEEYIKQRHPEAELQKYFKR